MPRALITGITGQDGSYLAELLIEKGYEVHGVVRQTSGLECSRLKDLYQNPAIYNRRLFLHHASLEDSLKLRRILVEAAAEEIYHLASQSHVGLSFEMVESTCDITAMGTLKLLETLRHIPRPGRLFHASSSEIFGRPDVMPQDEQTPFRPITPYGCAKSFATQIVSVYRRTFNLFACNGILYNHESPRRGENFVTQKICRAAAAIKQGRQRELYLGNLTSQRDWGDARDYVRGMWLALQNPKPEDFLFATGELHTVQEVVEIAFATVGLDWRKCVKQDEKLVRPEEPARLVGNAAKARDKLAWHHTISFQQLIAAMANAALAAEPPIR
jgi:GDPmannose 4,6-dehydratase